MNPNDNTPKLMPEHLSRKAVVYLRQSSLSQVKHNQESQRLQYALVDTAKAYGFTQVEVVDCDLGMSAAVGAQTREGFTRVLASVALGEVGLVLSRELSRLSRTDKDWCQLIEVCQIFNTLIADAENLYDLNRLDDQLMLGIKGTLSVVELKTLKFRLQQGREAKARRGELGRCLAPGYVADPAGQILKDPNLRVQEAVALVFKKFRELGSIRQTHRWFHEQNIELPVNKPLGGTFQLVWKLPSVSFVSDLLHNPLHAGAYVYGRRPTEVKFKAGQAVKQQRSTLPAEESSVFIPDHHPGYTSWEEYQRNQDIMRSNGGNFTRDESALAVRNGQGLLTGLLRCGHCGRKLHIRYWGKSGTAARYVCMGDFATGGQYCLGFGGATVDKRLNEEILKAVSPYSLKASLAAIDQLDNQVTDQQAALERQLQQVQYEAQRAFDQYNRADPTNRLVTEVLERRWNEKLEILERLQGERDAYQPKTVSLTGAEIEVIQALGNDFTAVWNHPACSMTSKKKIARTLINEIVVDLDEAAQTLQMVIHWHGGCHTALTLPKPQSGAVAHKTALEDIELITKMARRYGDDEIARVLSKLGRRTGKGNRWSKSRVAYVRKKYAIDPPDEAARDTSILTLAQAVEYSGASNTALMKLIRENILTAHQIAPYAPLEIRCADLDGEPVSGILKYLKKTGKLVLKGVPSLGQRDLFNENQ